VIPAGSYFNCNGESTAQWKVKNSTKSGVMQLTNGFPLSVNTYFAQLEKAVGLCETVKMAQKFGIVIPPDTPGYSVVTGPFTLGTMNVSPLDMAAAYATAASGGMYCAPLPVSEILDRNGNLIKKYEPKCKRAIPEEAANQINQILTAVQLPGGYGAGAGATLNIPSAAKTGTTTSGKSVWFTGYTPELVTASMLAGVTDKGLPRSLEGVTIKGKGRIGVASGSSLASPMWKAAMGKIQDSLAPAPFDPAPPHAYWAMRAAEYAADNPDAHSVLAGTNRYNR
jgi:membrane peptidoglycan carboxypeptidase